MNILMFYLSYLLILGDMTCTYRASYYHPDFSLVKLNGKSAEGSFAYDRSKSKAEVYNAFTEFIQNEIDKQNNPTSK
jgi:hypothetical protein